MDAGLCINRVCTKALHGTTVEHGFFWEGAGCTGTQGLKDEAPAPPKPRSITRISNIDWQGKKWTYCFNGGQAHEGMLLISSRKGATILYYLVKHWNTVMNSKHDSTLELWGSHNDHAS